MRHQLSRLASQRLLDRLPLLDLFGQELVHPFDLGGPRSDSLFQLLSLLILSGLHYGFQGVLSF